MYLHFIIFNPEIRHQPFRNKNNKIKEEIEKLKQSIEKREKLLQNENYVNKAPKNIVDLDREKLKKEKEELKILMNKVTD